MCSFFLLRRNRFLEVRERLGRWFQILQLAANMPDGAYYRGIVYLSRAQGGSKIFREILCALFHSNRAAWLV